MSTLAHDKPVEFKLSQLTSSLTFHSHDIFRGKVTKPHSYNASTHVASFTLSPLRHSSSSVPIKVQLEGSWAESAMRHFTKGRRVVLTMHHGPRIVERVKKRSSSSSSKDWIPFKIDYRFGIEGWWEDEMGKGDSKASQSPFKFIPGGQSAYRMSPTSDASFLILPNALQLLMLALHPLSSLANASPSKHLLPLLR